MRRSPTVQPGRLAARRRQAFYNAMRGDDPGPGPDHDPHQGRAHAWDDAEHAGDGAVPGHAPAPAPHEPPAP